MREGKILFFVQLMALIALFLQPGAVGWARAEPLTAFVHVNLVPMTKEVVLQNQTVLIQGERIVAIGPSDRIAAPADARIIEGTDAFLMPGLADMHMHIRADWPGSSWPVSPFRLYLANGVTTIRCFGPSGKTGKYVLKWRDEIQSGKRIGPQIYTCGPILRGPVRHPERVVIKQKYQGFDFIKLYSYLSPGEYHEAMNTARKLKRYTAGHIPFQVGLDGVITAGMDEIAHVEELFWELVDFDRHKNLTGAAWLTYVIEKSSEQFRPLIELDMAELESRLRPSVESTAAKLKDRQIPVCTTLFLDEVIIQKLFHLQAFLKKPQNRYLPQWYIERLRQGKEKHQQQFAGGEEFAPYKYLIDKGFLKELKKNHVVLLLATDAGTGAMGLVPGFSIHDELRILVENGFTPYEAIATGTKNIAPVIQKMTGQATLGTIEVGHRADLLLVERNPLEDVAHIRKLRGVMAAGRWYDKQSLQQMTALDSSAAPDR